MCQKPCFLFVFVLVARCFAAAGAPLLPIAFQHVCHKTVAFAVDQWQPLGKVLVRGGFAHAKDVCHFPHGTLAFHKVIGNFYNALDYIFFQIVAPTLFAIINAPKRLFMTKFLPLNYRQSAVAFYQRLSACSQNATKGGMSNLEPSSNTT